MIERCTEARKIALILWLMALIATVFISEVTRDPYWGLGMGLVFIAALGIYLVMSDSSDG